MSPGPSLYMTSRLNYLLHWVLSEGFFECRIPPALAVIAGLRKGDRGSKLRRHRDARSTPVRAYEKQFEVGQNIKQVVDFKDIGEVAERLNAPVLKTGVPSQEP